MCRKSNTGTQAGFTLLEAVVILLILGILVAVAVPKMASLRDYAVNAVTMSIIANVNTGIMLYRLTDESHLYPDRLDYANPGDSPEVKPFFEVVIVDGIRDPEWSKIADLYTYRAPNDSGYTYDPVSGRIR